MNSKKYSSTIINLINVLFFILPISYFFGNFIINLEVFFIAVLGLILYHKSIFKIKNDTPLVLLTFFFLIVLISTVLDSIKQEEIGNIGKSLLYLRYLFFLLVLNYMIKKELLNLKYFLLSCFACSIFVSLDVIFQYISGIDFFGFKSSGYPNSGFFGKELIAGSYIQRFACLGIFFIPLFFYNNKKKLFLISILCSAVFFSAIILSGNRMPAMIFLLFLLLSILLIKETRYASIISIFICVLIFMTITNKNQKIKSHYSSFYQNINIIFPNITGELKRDYDELEKEKEYFAYDKAIAGDKLEKYKILAFGSGHSVIFITAIDTWKSRPILGGGIKSFRVKCLETLHRPNRVCDSHPHNYYLDILNDVGLIGFLLILSSLVIIIVKKIKIKKKESNKLNNYDLIFYAIMISLIIEFFPFRSSGGFFSTNNSAFIFLLLGIFLNYSKIKKQFKIK